MPKIKQIRILAFITVSALGQQVNFPNAAPVLLLVGPGAINPQVTQGNIGTTICKPGWTKTVRPPVSFTNNLKLEQLVGMRLTGAPTAYEEDHRVPLELGGHPTSRANLWPEPLSGHHNAHDKDRLENAVKRDVCAGRMTLLTAQQIFMGDYWEEFDRRYKSVKGAK